MQPVKFKQSGYKPHRATFGLVELRLFKKSSTGEFVVRWFEAGKYNEIKSYYTDDLIDAMQTMDRMGQNLLSNVPV